LSHDLRHTPKGETAKLQVIMQAKTEELLTVHEIAAILKVSRFLGIRAHAAAWN